MSQKRHKPGRTTQYRRKRTLATRPLQPAAPRDAVILPAGIRRFLAPRIIGPGSFNWDSAYKLAVMRAYSGQIQREVVGAERFEVRLVPSRFTVCNRFDGSGVRHLVFSSNSEV
jgi:hypothetical protein